MKSVLSFALFLLLGAIAAPLFAQGVQTGTIRGVVKDQQGLAVPGTTITATSPALQGARTTVTDTQGNYSITALPPGTYALKFTLSGFGEVTRSVTLPLGLTIEQNATIQPAGVSEQVQVTATLPTPIATSIVGANLKHEEIEALATPRTLEGIATLSPGVTENSTNSRQMVVNGAMAFDWSGWEQAQGARARPGRDRAAAVVLRRVAVLMSTTPVRPEAWLAATVVSSKPSISANRSRGAVRFLRTR
jgi:hypothetical protein